MLKYAIIMLTACNNEFLAVLVYLNKGILVVECRSANIL